MVLQTAGGPDKDAKDRESTASGMKTPIKYYLPDGTEIILGDEKYLAPELLFYPEKGGYEFMGVHEMLISSINKADVDLKKELYGSIYLAGGSTKFPGFATRILNELKDKKLENMPVMQIMQILY